MSKDLHQRDAAQARGSKLLLAMGIIVLLGALAYFILTLVVGQPRHHLHRGEWRDRFLRKRHLARL